LFLTLTLLSPGATHCRILTLSFLAHRPTCEELIKELATQAKAVAARAAAPPPPPQAPLTQKRSNSFSQSFRRAPHMYHFPQHPLQTLLPTTNILTVCCLPAHSSPSRLPNGTGHVSHVTRSARSPSPGPICMVPEDPQAYREPKSMGP